MTVNIDFKGYAAIITLNRPHRYNATDLDTVFQISSFIKDVRNDVSVKKIILTSNHPKAFCAGGDVRMAYDAIKRNDISYGKAFFEAEYGLVYDLATYPKPVISLVNGLCLGGGMGLSMHNQIRIITENAILGMPETIIGFFPDVGASYRFANFPRPWCNFYGLTGNNIALTHAIKWNMADYYVHSSLLPELLDNLCETKDDLETVKQFSSTMPEDVILGELVVEKAFCGSLSEIFAFLQNDATTDSKKMLSDLNARSPLSLAVTSKLLEISRFLDLKKSLELDRILATNFMLNPDLQEGIRAQVVDKDKQPKWHYDMPKIDDEIVRDFFIPTYSDIEFCEED